MLGAYYLHENGDLIWKPEATCMNTSVTEYMDSPFVIKYWIMPKESPMGSVEKDIHWTMDWMLEAIRLSKDKERTAKRIQQICEVNKFESFVYDKIMEVAKWVK